MNANRDRVIVLALLAGSALAAAVELAPRFSPQPAPAPAPGPAPGGLNLRGLWVGESAAADASAFAGLCRGMVQALRVDLEQGWISTGVQIEELRLRACQGHFLPRSLSASQPGAMAAVGRYLEQTLGKSGGPVDRDRKLQWISALEALAIEAEESIR